jgi:hypothetical protein
LKPPYSGRFLKGYAISGSNNMKKRLAFAFLALFLAVTFSPVRATSQENDKPASKAQDPEPLKAKTSGPAPAPATADEKNVAKPADPKTLRINQPSDRVQLSTAIVNVVISVTDPYGRFVTGLGKDHFEVFDDKVKQQIAHFSDEDAPVSLGIVYDVSVDEGAYQPLDPRAQAVYRDLARRRRLFPDRL